MIFSATMFQCNVSSPSSSAQAKPSDMIPIGDMKRETLLTSSISASNQTQLSAMNGIGDDAPKDVSKAPRLDLKYCLFFWMLGEGTC